MPNIADTIKKQTDRILRQRQLNINANIVIQGNPSGDPSVSQPLDQAAHDALDHTGLTGIPAAEAFTEAVHGTTDHTGITGCGYTLPQATGDALGGIKAATKTEAETQEVKIDETTGKLYVPAAGDAANGIPAGGSAGQMLYKNSGTDYDAFWDDAPSGGASESVWGGM